MQECKGDILQPFSGDGEPARNLTGTIGHHASSFPVPPAILLCSFVLLGVSDTTAMAGDEGDSKQTLSHHGNLS